VNVPRIAAWHRGHSEINASAEIPTIIPSRAAEIQVPYWAKNCAAGARSWEYRYARIGAGVRPIKAGRRIAAGPVQHEAIPGNAKPRTEHPKLSYLGGGREVRERLRRGYRHATLHLVKASDIVAFNADQPLTKLPLRSAIKVVDGI
jgi:hypothetical protein